MELAGDVNMAERYCQQAGPELAETIETIFK